MEVPSAARPATMADLDNVVALVNRDSRAWSGYDRTTRADMNREWTEPGTRLSDDTRLVFAADGSLIAYAHYFNNRDPYVRPFAICCVDPGCRVTWDWTGLLTWAEKRARMDLRTAPDGTRFTLLGGADAGDAVMIDSWIAAGFAECRRFLDMEIDLETGFRPATVPPGYRVGPARPGSERAVFDALIEAFGDHYGFITPASPEDEFARFRHHTFDAPDYDPELQIVAVDARGEIAGASLCNPSHAGDPDLGWIASLAVRKEHRRRGLGEALLLRSFETLRGKGKRRVGLGVDSDSLTGATGLYTRCGMHEVKAFIEVEKVLRDGTELANLG